MNHAMLVGLVLTIRAGIETNNEATHEESGSGNHTFFFVRAYDGGLRSYSNRVRAVLRLWVPIGRSIGASKRDERGRQAGSGVEYGEREGTGREAARIRSVRQEFAAFTSHGNRACHNGTRADGRVEREVEADEPYCLDGEDSSSRIRTRFNWLVHEPLPENFAVLQHA